MSRSAATRELAPSKVRSSSPGSAQSLSDKGFLAKLGPGLITGASDDDPSGIATYSQVGAQFGTGLLWTMLISYPLMAAIQEICARIGRVTGCGLTANLRKNYPRPLLYFVLVAMSAANVFNLGADIGAMGASLALIVPANINVLTVTFGIISLIASLHPLFNLRKVSEMADTLSFLLRWRGFLVHISWPSVRRATLIPHVALNKKFLIAIIAVLGTTSSPYLFFWQASQEVEEVRANRGEKALKHAPAQASTQLDRIHTDTYVGMAFSNVVAFFIILTAASTLHIRGITEVAKCAQAAAALQPIAGRFATALFLCGIVGTGMLAVPVLAASAAYGIGEGCQWCVSLERRPLQAVGFYSVISIAIVTGLALNFLHIDPVRALYWSAILNGLVAAPLMTVIMMMASNRKVMGRFVIPTYLRWVGWCATIVMLCVCFGVVLSWKAG
jgi:Mn2+/Fe2+ NRAMP family transporter